MEKFHLWNLSTVGVGWGWLPRCVEQVGDGRRADLEDVLSKMLIGRRVLSPVCDNLLVACVQAWSEVKVDRSGCESTGCATSVEHGWWPSPCCFRGCQVEKAAFATCVQHGLCRSV